MFVHLHNHFTGSYSDSALKIEEGVAKAHADGQPAAALTDHGEIAAVHRFHDACRANGVKPLFGSELYFVRNAAECIERSINDRFHLVAIAKNATGLRNLYSLSSEAWVSNSYKERRGLVDWELLERYREGLVILTGCYFNILGQTISWHGPEAGEKVLRRFVDLFGADFHIEVGRHHIAEEEKILGGMLELAGKYGLNPVATNDVHYLDREDWLTHEVIIRTRYDRPTELKANSLDYWLKTEEEMAALGMPPEYLEATLGVADSCDDIVIPPAPVQTAAAPSVPPDDIEGLIAAGRAAYLARINYIDAATAQRHAVEVLKEGHPAAATVAARIAGIPRSSEPDTDYIVCSPSGPLREIVPLKRSLGKIITQWDADSCRRAGALVIPVTPSPFAEKLNGILK